MNDKQASPLAVSDVSRSENISFNRRTILKILTVICAGVASLLYGLNITGEVPETPATTERSETMYPTKQNTNTNNKIPAINVAAPVKTETATFALG
jgi:hypothetical protein